MDNLKLFLPARKEVGQRGASYMTKIEVLEREHISQLVEQAGSVYQLSKRQGYNRFKFLTSSRLISQVYQSLLKLNEFKSQEVDCEIINS